MINMNLKGKSEVIIFIQLRFVENLTSKDIFFSTYLSMLRGVMIHNKDNENEIGSPCCNKHLSFLPS
jgi:hypothetical protein